MKCTLREWQTTFKEPKELVCQASGMDGSDGWTEWLIGMGHQYSNVFHLGASIQQGSHENLVFCAIHPTTDVNRRGNASINRKTILNTLAKSGIQNKMINSMLYFTSLPSYKFVISPEGNGIDCHRHAEAIVAGSIPILERNPLTDAKYATLPVLWTTDYSEITQEYLVKCWDEMLDTKYDFSPLFVNSYDHITQRKIRAFGDYWINKHLGKSFYKEKS